MKEFFLILILFIQSILRNAYLNNKTLLLDTNKKINMLLSWPNLNDNLI